MRFDIQILTSQKKSKDVIRRVKVIKSYQKTSLMSIQMYLFVEFFNF